MKIHDFRPRGLWDDDKPEGYLESDNDFIRNNQELVIEFLTACGASNHYIHVVNMCVRRSDK